jgi:hypothetical protein
MRCLPLCAAGLLLLLALAPGLALADPTRSTDPPSIWARLVPAETPHRRRNRRKTGMSGKGTNTANFKLPPTASARILTEQAVQVDGSRWSVSSLLSVG